MAKDTAVEDVDPGVLIEEVRKCRGIWDVADEDHSDRIKKRLAFFDLCRKFSPDFDEKSEAEKNDYCNKLTNKWRNIKDNYYRCVRKRAQPQLGSRPCKPYLYAKYLSFLPVSHLSTSSHLDASETYSESSDSVPIEPIATSEASDSSTRPQKRRRVEIQSSPVHVVSAPAIPSSPVPSMDEDRMFFESLFPILRTLDIDQKLEFRMEVMQLLKRVRLMTFQQPGHECQKCGYDGTEQAPYRGRPVRSSTSSKRAEASPDSYQAPVTYLMQDLHPDCVHKYDGSDS